MRNAACPICGSDSVPLLRLRFNQKLNLPTAPEIRHCSKDNFLFLAAGSQKDYDEYYQSLANDTVHAEVSGGSSHSIISKLQMNHLMGKLGGFFEQPKKILDFGCGEACLLVEMASTFATSNFFGFDPGPAAKLGSDKAIQMGLRNLVIGDLRSILNEGPFDLIIASHVVEHLLDFDLLHLLSDAMAELGLFYVEVPNSLKYSENERQEFLYYFDRLHVNHFTPQSLAHLVRGYGLGYVDQFEYGFPYRDGGQYPALGMLFRKDEPVSAVSSLSICEIARRYILQEKQRAADVARQFELCDGLLIWGAGDNFFRSSENDGPISGLQNMLVLDRRQQDIEVGGRKYSTVDPTEGILRHPWPVVITISEGRKAIAEQVKNIDPTRRVFFI